MKSIIAMPCLALLIANLAGCGSPAPATTTTPQISSLATVPQGPQGPQGPPTPPPCIYLTTIKIAAIKTTVNDYVSRPSAASDCNWTANLSQVFNDGNIGASIGVSTATYTYQHQAMVCSVNFKYLGSPNTKLVAVLTNQGKVETTQNIEFTTPTACAETASGSISAAVTEFTWTTTGVKNN